MLLFPAPFALVSCFLSPFPTSSLSEKQKTELGNEIAAEAPSSDLSIYNFHLSCESVLGIGFMQCSVCRRNYLIVLQGMQTK